MISLPYMGIVPQYTFQQGQSPSFSQYTTWRSAEVQVCLNLKYTVTLYNYVKRSVKQASNKKVRPHECQESGLVLKVILSDLNRFQGQWMPNHKRWWKTCTSYESQCSQEILC